MNKIKNEIKERHSPYYQTNDEPTNGRAAGVYSNGVTAYKAKFEHGKMVEVEYYNPTPDTNNAKYQIKVYNIGDTERCECFILDTKTNQYNLFIGNEGSKKAQEAISAFTEVQRSRDSHNDLKILYNDKELTGIRKTYRNGGLTIEETLKDGQTVSRKEY